MLHTDRQAYRKAYYQANKAHILEHNKQYRETHKEQIRATQLRWAQEHREAHRLANRLYRERHLEKAKEHAKRWRTKYKFDALSHYSIADCPICAHCGITDVDVLCIDHINNDGATHRKKLKLLGGYNFYLWLRQQGYPEGFQVLCFNCNHKKRYRN